MQVMANDVGMSGVVTMLAELLGCSVTVEDRPGRFSPPRHTGPTSRRLASKTDPNQKQRRLSRR